jgi:23S rRNA (guanosine2251-2'-O)-methyltransferase
LEKQREDILFGRNPVFELFDTDIDVNAVYILKDSPIRAKAAALAKKKGCPLKEVREEKLALLSSGGVHQGIAASVAAIDYSEIDDIFALAKEKNEKPFMILLDSIEDPHNLGAIIRTAECAGAHGVIIEKRRSATVGETVMKTSAGAALHIPLVRIGNISQVIDGLKDKGVWVVGADMNGDNALEMDYDMPLCLVIGSEGQGLHRLVREKCDFIASIPMFGKINSLNASVAAGVLIYETVRSRKMKGGK